MSLTVQVLEFLALWGSWILDAENINTLLCGIHSSLIIPSSLSDGHETIVVTSRGWSLIKVDHSKTLHVLGLKVHEHKSSWDSSGSWHTWHLWHAHFKVKRSRCSFSLVGHLLVDWSVSNVSSNLDVTTSHGWCKVDLAVTLVCSVWSSSSHFRKFLMFSKIIIIL